MFMSVLYSTRSECKVKVTIQFLLALCKGDNHSSIKKWAQEVNMFKKDWVACSKYDNHLKLNNQHNVFLFSFVSCNKIV